MIAVFAMSSASLGCTRGQPPAPSGVDAAVAIMPAAGPSAPLATAAASDRDEQPKAGVSAIDAGRAEASERIDRGDPGALPQTRDRPAPSSPELDARARALWDAIAHDEPDRALPAFFPVTAYEQVKAIPSPASDWRHRLVGAFKRDVHGLAKRLGSKAESARFVRLDIPDERARWVEPNEESNKLGYWRVYGTRIVYEVDGRERALDVSSLISWRGEWYVVHLTGFK